ncbi:o-succinylbenzoate synthase [Bacillaceae bacterium Marseille-Q3522]|nr:o-succinylbenzoate synthase [Bacillaceae bacterium Marseille-Q3522]
MKIKSISLYHLSMPLKAPFTTHLGTVTERETLLVEVTDKDGRCGYGEAVPFSTPWYTEETIGTAYHIIRDCLIPLLQKNNIAHPDEIFSLFTKVRRNFMAKAGLETAIWDLYAKQCVMPLAKLLGGTRQEVFAGAVVATNDIETALLQIGDFLSQGYKRVKLKINPVNDYAFIRAIRSAYPNLPLMADANSAYTLKDGEKLKALDMFRLMMIEQPLSSDDIADHHKLQKQLQTPICLDESIVTFQDVRQAVELGSCQIVNIKVARVGGHVAAKKIHDYCIQHNIPVWCGGMIEFGVAKAHSIAIASLPGFTIPGDLSSSKRYWDEDIIIPEIEIEQGKIIVSGQPGIGYQINKHRVKEVTAVKEQFFF